jgi:AraC family transcriptional activator of pobA
MAIQSPYRFKTINDYHRFRNLSNPAHPLFSIIDVSLMERLNREEPTSIVLDFYCIAMKRNFNCKMKYGQQEYDFDEGIMSFVSPSQVFSIEQDGEGTLKHSGWLLMVHPDFLWNTSLSQKMSRYEFFSYAVREALFLSDKEEAIIEGILQNINQEYQSNIDHFSQELIIAQLEVLFTYAHRFYERQFITRKIINHEILVKVEDILVDYFHNNKFKVKGLPTVQYIAESLNFSPGYLGAVLRVLTGKSTQQHIHDKLIEIAKEKLSASGLSVSEIAYGLGFEHPQSFTKLFKTKTGLGPAEFRQSFRN